MVIEVILSMKIAVVGSGYVGLVTGACLAEAGHKVFCIDNDPAKIRSLRKSQVPFYEPRLQAILSRAQASGHLKFTSSYSSALKEVKAIFLCVGTPPTKSGKPNLNYLEQAITSISQSCEPKKTIAIFIKSTVMVGANAYAQKYLKKISKFHNKLIFASNPEFLKDGNAVMDFKHPERIIIGTDNTYIKDLSRKIYKKFDHNPSIIQFTAVESAELIKYSSNAFLATKISFMNEISRLCDAVGANIDEIKAGMGADTRIGNKFLNAGLGFGGSCFPKDLDGLIMNYKDSGLESKIAEAAKHVNASQLGYFLQKIESNITLKNSTLLVWGLSFKPETDDLRESISIKLIKTLSKKVKNIYVYDPVSMKNGKKLLSDLHNVIFLKHQYEKIGGCDALILATEWKQFQNPAIEKLLKLKNRLVFDGRNFLNSELLKENNLRYVGIGKK